MLKVEVEVEGVHFELFLFLFNCLQFFTIGSFFVICVTILYQVPGTCTHLNSLK